MELSHLPDCTELPLFPRKPADWSAFARCDSNWQGVGSFQRWNFENSVAQDACGRQKKGAELDGYFNPRSWTTCWDTALRISMEPQTGGPQNDSCLIFVFWVPCSMLICRRASHVCQGPPKRGPSNPNRVSYCGWTKSCTTSKLWATIVCWYLRGNHHSRDS